MIPAAVTIPGFLSHKSWLEICAIVFPAPPDSGSGLMTGNYVTFSWKDSINVVLERVSNITDRIGGTSAG
jgi:hypothetical protein